MAAGAVVMYRASVPPAERCRADEDGAGAAMGAASRLEAAWGASRHARTRAGCGSLVEQRVQTLAMEVWW